MWEPGPGLWSSELGPQPHARSRLALDPNLIARHDSPSSAVTTVLPASPSSPSKRHSRQGGSTAQRRSCCAAQSWHHDSVVDWSAVVQRFSTNETPTEHQQSTNRS
ncbi:hypothetical protein DHEL01_v213090 [Diaporthe helianthi]|uniref:Uncharacterized protein n=1 Tax=Diaporthe helianthi TaxID=158607 RepID=A0A2P5HE31_DIAHE|nr:hypothetical protein DHEL01_v213090 [Diaporthe helianthi]